MIDTSHLMELEKSAKFMTDFIEKSDFYEGVLDYEEFSRSYDLRCYRPSADLAPFVEHYFISRRRQSFDLDYVGEDILSQPVATLFFTPLGSFVQGPTTRTRRLIAKTTPLYAGAQFKPGGFYSFLRKEMSGLAEKTIPAEEFFPKTTQELNQRILSLDDQSLLESIEQTLREGHPKPYPHLHMAKEIILYIEKNCITTTVADTAKHFAMSERSLQYIFRVYVGIGVKWAIMRARFLEIIKFARQQEELNWTAVANEFGYSDQAHFNHDFKKLIGITPRQYERSLRQN